MDGTHCIGRTTGGGNQNLTTYDTSSLRTTPATKKPSIAESPNICETPVRERRLSRICEKEMYSRTRLTTSSASLSNLPILTTPPSRFKNLVIKNPFDETLKNKLHLPFISPTLFTRTISPSQNADNFSWSIEDLANLLPAEIDEYQMQNDQSSDEQIEQEVQKRISRFFESNNIVPSPWGTFETIKPLFVSDLSDTPERSTSTEDDDDDAVTTELDFEDMENYILPSAGKEAWTQTELTVPIEILSPFDSLCEQFQSEKEQNGTDIDMTNVEKSSTAQDDVLCSSPCYNLYKSLLSSTIHTPKNKIIRSFGTPLGCASVMSPIGLSPIVHSFQQVTRNIEISKDSAGNMQCTCHMNGISCDSGISSALSQTDVSFPSILPKSIEEVLKPFQTFIQDPSEIEDVNLNSSLSRRRKLLFNEKLDMSVSSIHSHDNGYDSS